MKKEIGFNIDLTTGQYSILYDLVLERMPTEYGDKYDMQTYENLLDAITNAKSTYLGGK